MRVLKKNCLKLDPHRALSLLILLFHKHWDIFYITAFILLYCNLKSREINWLIGKHSPLSMSNKLLIYKTVLRPVWTYGIELWGCTATSSIDIIQRYQSKMLRSITNAPWYVTNQTLHQDLRIPLIRTVYRERTAAHHDTLRAHTNPLMETLLNPPSNRSLKRKWTCDETN